ncbi:hypothetical protein RRG08_061384 [Elysia crispata]|uniref:Uncharacterized protein n=1 Tax=Elysia crispata TaxID=231223 RepID=A0AAE1AFC6_9GAST|nr:hypothetical protein RRG08_061384 [Elysia crispata]
MTSFAASCPPGGRLQTAGQDARNRPSPHVSPRDGRLDSEGNKREGTIVKHSIFNQIERSTSLYSHSLAAGSTEDH